MLHLEQVRLFLELIWRQYLIDDRFSFLFMIKHILPMMLAISWVYWVSMLVQAIVYEKEQRLKEVRVGSWTVDLGP